MPLSDVIDIIVSTQNAIVARAGFGVPLILSHNAAFPERTRTYTDLAGMVTDGFAATSPEYLAASAMWSQTPAPSKIKVGRAPLKPTQRFKITPVAANAALYKVRVGANWASFTSDASGTVAEIVAGLVAAINGLTGDTATASDLSTHLYVTGNTAGAWDGLEVNDTALLSIEQDHADPGVATDLDAIKLYDNDWYGLVTLYNSQPYVAAASAWVEANEKLYVVDSCDTPIITTATGGSDVASALQTSGKARTGLLYHPATDSFLAASLQGSCLPLDPGSETWKFKTLPGVAYTKFTATHLANLQGKNAGYYYSVAGRSISADGKVAAGEWIDTIRGRDWLKARIQEDVFVVIAGAQKVPYTEAGVELVLSPIRGRLKDAVATGFLSPSPEPTVSAPKVSEVNSTDKAARLLPNVTFTGTLAGAIHKLSIKGTLKV